MNKHTNVDEHIIKYSRPELPRCLNETEAELRRTVAPIWQMRGRLVEMIRLDADAEADGVKRHAGALQIHVLNDHRLLELMLGSVKFASWNERRKVWVRSAPPLEFSRHYNARGAWGLRVLRGIVEAPTMRLDGTILSQPGYDDATGIYLDTGGVEFPPIPDQPTHRQALVALGKLK